MDPPAEQHQHGQLANRKSKKGRNTQGEDFKLFLAELSVYITRELVLNIVLFFLCYFILTRFNIIVAFLVNIFSTE